MSELDDDWNSEDEEDLASDDAKRDAEYQASSEFARIKALLTTGGFDRKYARSYYDDARTLLQLIEGKKT